MALLRPRHPQVGPNDRANAVASPRNTPNRVREPPGDNQPRLPPPSVVSRETHAFLSGVPARHRKLVKTAERDLWRDEHSDDTLNAFTVGLLS